MAITRFGSPFWALANSDFSGAGISSCNLTDHSVDLFTKYQTQVNTNAFALRRIKRCAKPSPFRRGTRRSRVNESWTPRSNWRLELRSETGCVLQLTGKKRR